MPFFIYLTVIFSWLFTILAWGNNWLGSKLFNFLSGGVEKYKRIDQLDWSDEELLQGKLVKINKFPKDKKVKLFWVTVSPSRTEYVVTNDLTQDYTPEVQAICSIRWNIEEFHREHWC